MFKDEQVGTSPLVGNFLEGRALELRAPGWVGTLGQWVFWTQDTGKPRVVSPQLRKEATKKLLINHWIGNPVGRRPKLYAFLYLKQAFNKDLLTAAWCWGEEGNERRTPTMCRHWAGCFSSTVSLCPHSTLWIGLRGKSGSERVYEVPEVTQLTWMRGDAYGRVCQDSQTHCNQVPAQSIAPGSGQQKPYGCGTPGTEGERQASFWLMDGRVGGKGCKKTHRAWRLRQVLEPAFLDAN